MGRYTRRTVPIATFTFGFDPILSLGPDVAVRWQTLGLAAVVAAGLIWSGIVARRVDLRADDLLSIAVGAVPGAVVVGRLGWIVAHPGAVPPDLWLWMDPSVGGFDLAAAVLGGIGSAAAVASLLGAPVVRWTQVLTVPLLATLGGAKLAMVLGGSGQGLPADVSWATAFTGPGPWGSLAASVPSHPSQVYEAIGAVTVAAIAAVVHGVGAGGRPDGRMLLVAVGGWAAMRAVVSVTWRDPVVAGPLGASGWLAVVVAVVSFAAASGLVMIARRRLPVRVGDGDDLRWPDPASRPRF